VVESEVAGFVWRIRGICLVVRDPVIDPGAKTKKIARMREHPVVR
jgi:hypothetical protein